MAKDINEKEQELETIVPEYLSKNLLIKWIFNRRLTWSVNSVKNYKNLSILDAWCGDWRLAKMLSDSWCTDVTAIDFNKNVTKLTYKNVKFSCEDLTKTSFTDNSFDIIIILDVLEHFENLDKPLAELNRLLKKDWKLLVSMPTENIIYKIGRFILKWTFSMEDWPGTGIHYHTAKNLSKIIANKFDKISNLFHPFFPPFDLFHLSIFKSKK